MFRRTPLYSSLLAAFGGTAMLIGATAHAQDASTTQQLQRVEVTGSAIKRIDAETAVPITILKVEDLKKQGFTTVEEILNSLSVSQATQGTSQSVGLGTGGASFANLRGLGQNKTLVLLNGRRLANNAIDNTAPDLNMIPFAALERVEVLHDGASSLYGTDAVAGVINFITRRDFTGGTITLGADSPEAAGGKAYNANVGFGFGDLGKDNFNVFGFVDWQKQYSMTAAERPDILARSIKTSQTTSPGQYNQGGAVQNPSFPICGTPDGIPTGDGVKNANCGYLYSRKVDLVPATERKTGYLSGTLQITPDHQAGLEYFITDDRNTTLIAGVPYGALWVNPGTKYYPGNGITPLPTVFTLDPTYLPSSAPAGALPGVIKLRWRDTASGGRNEQTDNTQQRFIASLQGTVSGWDYKTAFSYNENKLTDSLIGGYTDGTQITTGILNGTINPFGPQDAAGAAFVAAAGAKGVLFTGKGQVYSFDAQGSRDLGDWLAAGRPAAIAVGTEFRREKFTYKGNSSFDALVVSSTGFDPSLDDEGSRNVFAVYTELNLPVIKSLDVTASVRYDKYSDFGSTVNPKIAFRFQPLKEALVRGSYSTGFRAPSLYELHAPQTYTNSADPPQCSPAVPGVAPTDCGPQGLQVEVLNGGNPNLKPERSKNWNLGFVLQPTDNLNASIDFWWIHLTHQISTLTDTTVFQNSTKYQNLYHLAPDGSLSTDGSLCPGANCGYVSLTNLNLGGVNTNGIDLSLEYRLRTPEAGVFNFGFNGTYVTQYEYQNEEGGDWNQNVGIFSGTGPIFRKQFTASVNWNLKDWSVGLANHYKSGYIDQDPSNTVGDWSTWDTYATWKPIKSVSLTFGIRNLLDRAPPYSNQTTTFQVGYDPRYADATGRAYYLRGTYTF